MKKLMIFLMALGGLLMSNVVLAEGSVARAIVTTAVVDREPGNDLARVQAGNDKVYFFTELRDMAGQSVTHRWSYGGEAKAEVSFDVRGPRWRVWSSKTLLPEWTGGWTVEVVDSEGKVLSEKQFEFVAEGKPAATEEPAAEAAPMEAAPEVEAPAEAPAASEDAPAAQ